jgi:hypothetical protein
VLAEKNAGQPGGDRGERSTILERTIRFGVPCIDVTGAAGHPEEDHGAVRGEGSNRAGAGITGEEQSGKGKTGAASEACLEEAAARSDEETFRGAGSPVAEGVRMKMSSVREGKVWVGHGSAPSPQLGRRELNMSWVQGNA